jgi:hypothetical protein
MLKENGNARGVTPVKSDMLPIMSCVRILYQYFLRVVTVFVIPLPFSLLLLVFIIVVHHDEQAWHCSISIVKC